MDAADIEKNGWTAVPVSAATLLGGKAFIREPTKLLVEDIKFPSDDSIVAKVQAYVQARLSPQTVNHSMRVFYYATAILQQQFPSHAALSPSTLALTCLLHDIGTAEDFLTTTRLSFEFRGAIVALELLTSQTINAPRDQAEAVCETIIRHQDLGVDGNITFLGQLIQLATIYDNVGECPGIKGFGGILHEATREDVNAKFPRGGWLGCFATTIRREIGLKPWCHSTHIPDFDKKVEGNELMRPYE